MQMRDKIVINDYIENDPLSEENLDKTLVTVYEIRLLFPNKTIWIYSGYTWNQIMNLVVTSDFNPERDEVIRKRKEIVKQCSVMVDGKYIDSQRDVTLKWRGSKNQHVIDIKQSLQKGEIVLWTE